MRQLNWRQSKMIQPFGDKRFKLFEVENSTLRLGIKVDSTNGMRAVQLVMFAIVDHEYREIDALNFYRTGSSMYPFAWDHYARSDEQSRADVKSRLYVLGFDPRIVDSAFPASEDEQWNVKHLVRADCAKNVAT